MDSGAWVFSFTSPSLGIMLHQICSIVIGVVCCGQIVNGLFFFFFFFLTECIPFSKVGLPKSGSREHLKNGILVCNIHDIFTKLPVHTCSKPRSF